MLEGRIFRCIDANGSAFRAKFKDLPANIQKEAIERFRRMFGMRLDEVPAAWHMHMLQNKTVPSRFDSKKKVNVWTMHLNAADTYKASFTLEDMTAFLRTCGEHDTVDKKP